MLAEVGEWMWKGWMLAEVDEWLGVWEEVGRWMLGKMEEWMILGGVDE